MGEACRQCRRNGKTVQEALERAVDCCIEHGILSEVLRSYRGEVLGMLLEEFDVEKYERTIRNQWMEVGIDQGIEIGKGQGIEIGKDQGIEIGQGRVNRLTSLLLAQNRLEDLKRSVQEVDYQEKLFREFNL